MTTTLKQDEIIEMAESAGMTRDGDMWFTNGESDMDVHIDQLEAFAKLVAAKEREACAKICDRKDEAWKKAGLWNQSFEYKECAEAIRARGEQHES